MLILTNVSHVGTYIRRKALVPREHTLIHDSDTCMCIFQTYSHTHIVAKAYTLLLRSKLRFVCVIECDCVCGIDWLSMCVCLCVISEEQAHQCKTVGEVQMLRQVCLCRSVCVCTRACVRVGRCSRARPYVWYAVCVSDMCVCQTCVCVRHIPHEDAFSSSPPSPPIRVLHLERIWKKTPV